MKKFLSAALAAALAASFAAGCRKEAPTTRENVLRKYIKNDAPTLDPALISEVYGGTVAAHLFNGLIRFDADMQPTPDAAERWEVSPDGMAYTFHLREGARFAGETPRPVTANDFIYSFERVLRPETAAPYPWVFDYVLGAAEFREGKADRVTGFEAPDDRTLVIRMERPHAPFLAKLAMPTAYAVQREQVEKWGEDLSRHIAGTGPFLLDEWEDGNRILLKANPDYFEGKPSLDAIEYRVIPQNFTQEAEFERGGIDLLYPEGTDYSRYKNDPKWREYMVETADLSVHYLGFNTRKKPFDDPRVRRAANHAVDRQAIIDNLYDGRYIPAAGPVPPSLPGNDPDLEGYSYDPEKARGLLKEAGFENGLEVTIGLRETQTAQEAGEAIQGYLEKAGFTVHLLQMEKSALFEAMTQGKLDALYTSWLMDYPDAENFLFPQFHSSNQDDGGNRSKFQDPEIDRLIDAARSEGDDEKRNALYRQAEAAVSAAAPWLFLWHPASAAVRQPWIKGYRPYPVYYGDKGLDLRIEREP